MYTFATALQSFEVPDPSGIDVVASLGGSAISTAVTTILLGAILVALAPAYTERKMDEVRENVVGSFVYGLVSLVFLLLVMLVLLITIIGIPLAILFGILAFVAWAIGSAIAFLAIADRLVDHEGGWLVPLLIAGGINGGLTLTGVGALVSFCVGAAGFGAVVRDYLG